MRIHIIFHNLKPHKNTCPLFLNKQPHKTPQMTSTNSHIQHYWNDHNALDQTVPYSYVIYPTNNYFTNFNMESAFTIGSHPNTTQPLSIGLIPENPLNKQLGHTSLNKYASQMDSTIQFYLKQFKTKFTIPKTPKSLDVPNLIHYIHTRNTIQMSPDLQNLITPNLLKIMTNTECK